jgi:hypothetical protein
VDHYDHPNGYNDHPNDNDHPNGYNGEHHHQGPPPNQNTYQQQYH